MSSRSTAQIQAPATLADFDLNLLLTLDVLLRERNVTRAAKCLQITQPATSARLARLRQYFGDELLIPAGPRGMRLSTRGEVIRTIVHSVVVSIDAALSGLRCSEPPRHISVALAQPESTCPSVGIDADDERHECKAISRRADST